MVLSTDTMDIEEGYDSKPPAIVDIDGVINHGDPLGIRFSQYLVERSYEEKTGTEIDTIFEEDRIEVQDESGESYEWGEIRDELGENSDFDPDSLEEIQDIWSDLQYSDDGEPDETRSYLEAVREITGHWMMGIVGRPKERIKRRGEEFIDNISVDIPRPFNNTIGMFQRDYNVILGTSNPQEVTDPVAELMGVEKGYGTVVASKDNDDVKGDNEYIPSFERNMAEGKDAILSEISNYNHPNAVAIGDMPTEYPLYANVQNIIHIVGEDEDITEDQLREEIEEYEQTRDNALNGLGNLVKKISGSQPRKNVFLLEDFDTLGSVLQSDSPNEIHEALGIK